MPRDEKRFKEERSKYIVTINGSVHHLALTDSQVNLLLWLEIKCEIEELLIQRFTDTDFIEP